MRNGHELEGGAYGVGDVLDVALVLLRQDDGLDPLAIGGEGLFLQSADGQDVPELLSGATEEVLYDGILNVNVAAELEKNGLSFENLKSFIITQGTLELVTPQGFDLNTFRTAKLYFDNRTALVAKADVVEAAARKVRFTIINGELLDKLKDDKLHVILTGIRPNVVVRLKLVMDYKAKVSLIK